MSMEEGLPSRERSKSTLPKSKFLLKTKATRPSNFSLSQINSGNSDAPDTPITRTNRTSIHIDDDEIDHVSVGKHSVSSNGLSSRNHGQSSGKTAANVSPAGKIKSTTKVVEKTRNNGMSYQKSTR